MADTEGYRVVRITRTAADDVIHPTAYGAQMAMTRQPLAEPGVEYGVVHTSFPLALSHHYIVAVSGGYDLPSYAYEATLDEAWARATGWSNEDEDATVEVLRVDPIAGTVERMDASEPVAFSSETWTSQALTPEQTSRRIPLDREGHPLAWPVAAGYLVDAWNGIYTDLNDLWDQWGEGPLASTEDERVLAYGEDAITSDEADERRAQAE